MTRHAIAFDPGTSGAIAVLLLDGTLLHVDDMPTETRGKRQVVSAPLLAQLVDDLAPLDVAVCVIEAVGAMPGNGSASSFGFGRSLGVLHGLAAAHRWPTEHPRPAQWKRDMGLTADKSMARTVAMQRWPLHAGRFERVKDDGRAEACLMAEWGRQRLIREGRG